jgi:hypothetical protein
VILGKEVIGLKRHIAVIALLIFAAIGCSDTRTSWEAGGDYHATLTVDDSTAAYDGQVYLTGGPQVEDEVKMCEVRNLTWALPFVASSPGAVASIRITLPQVLCRKGSYNISTGSVWTWQPVSGDTSTLKAQPASGWTVTGNVTVTEYSDFNHREPAVHERLLSETSKGTFSLAADGPNGELVRFQDGTFQFDIYVRKDPYNPFD